MISTDRSEEFLLVAELRKSVSNVAKDIQPSTIAEYEKIYARMLRDNQAPDDATSRSGYFLRRAALMYVCANQARQALRERDKSVFGSDEWQSALLEIERISSIFRSYPPDPERQNHAVGSTGRCWNDVRLEKESAGWKAESKSKRAGLSALLKRLDWSNCLFGAITPKYRAAYAIAFLTGARPAEIENGVSVRQYENALEITIRGAKIGEQRGQPERVILVSLDSKSAQFLATLAEGGRVTIQNNAKRFCDAVRNAGMRAFPRMRTTVSPYSLRHAVASSLKASGIDADGIAQVLGHRASRSQQVYGMCSQRSNNASSILGVRASIPVRNTRRSPIGIGGIGGATAKPKFS